LVTDIWKVALLQVTWIEHWEYDESVVHNLYRPLIISGSGFGAHRWIATLQRQCEGLAILMSSSISSDDHTGKPYRMHEVKLLYPSNHLLIAN
jgi:hypothetical protein